MTATLPEFSVASKFDRFYVCRTAGKRQSARAESLLDATHGTFEQLEDSDLMGAAELTGGNLCATDLTNAWSNITPDQGRG